MGKASSLTGTAKIVERNHGIFSVNYDLFNSLEDLDAGVVAKSQEFIKVDWGYPGNMNGERALSVSEKFLINLGDYEYVVFNFKNKNNSPYPDNSIYNVCAAFILENVGFEF